VGDVVEVTHPGDGQRLVEQDQPGLVPEELPYGDRFLAVLGELGPIVGDRSLVVDPAARVCHRQRHRRQALGDGHSDNHGVLVPRRVAFWPAAAAPQIDNLLAAPVNRYRGADFAALCEVALELDTNFFEAWRDLSIYGGHEASPFVEFDL
jgi:hypothetical protein